jgi:hypothetical protein
MMTSNIVHAWPVFGGLLVALGGTDWGSAQDPTQAEQACTHTHMARPTVKQDADHNYDLK